jgi:AraC family transcriptional regulator, positive regulator of tynA and feaB
METTMLETSVFAGAPQLDYEAWTDLLHSQYRIVSKIREPEAFAAQSRLLGICGFEAIAVSTQSKSSAIDPAAHAHRVDRTLRDARRDDVDHFRAIFSLSSRPTFYQSGEQVLELGKGSVAIVDMSRPWSASRDNGQWVIMMLPRQPLISHLGFEPRGGLHGCGGTIATRLLYQLVRSSIEDEEVLSLSAAASMQSAVYGLIGALLAPSDAVSRYSDKLFARIGRIIKDRFADPDFGPCEAAAEAGISLRYLQQLFTARGSTCTEFIHAVRLDHAARLLQRRAGLGQPLSEIAYVSGFRDYNHFARRFRHRFGHTPGTHAVSPAP